MQQFQLIRPLIKLLIASACLSFGLNALGMTARSDAGASGRSVLVTSRDVKTVPLMCPVDLEPLITKLLQDLPSYANRVRIRAELYRNYVIFAGKPDFRPLPVSRNSESQDPKTQQVFFTTLIRRYERDRIVYHQEHHRLFLAPDASGWRFVMMYSVLAPYPASQTPPLPPRNSSEGSIAQAIRDWLRDCRTGDRQSLQQQPMEILR
jgi:hypothetical protein